MNDILAKKSCFQLQRSDCVGILLRFDPTVAFLRDPGCCADGTALLSVFVENAKKHWDQLGNLDKTPGLF